MQNSIHYLGKPYCIMGNLKVANRASIVFFIYTQAFNMRPMITLTFNFFIVSVKLFINKEQTFVFKHHIYSDALIKSGYLPAESARVLSAPCLMTADHTGVSSNGGVVVSMVMTILVIFNHLRMIRETDT